MSLKDGIDQSLSNFDYSKGIVGGGVYKHIIHVLGNSVRIEVLGMFIQKCCFEKMSKKEERMMH